MRRNLWIAAAVALIVVVLLVGVAWATEAVQSRHPLQDQIARGTVKEVDGENVLVVTENGNLQVLISDRTALWVPGEPPTSTVQLATGDPVLALGRRAPGQEGSGALSARLIVVADEEELPKVLVRGRALAVTRQTIVVQSGNRERAITVLPRTRLWSTNGRLDSIGDIRPGDPLIALGQPTGLGQWIAGLVVVAGPAGTTREGLRGTVEALDTKQQALTVQTGTGSHIDVVTSADTVAPPLISSASRAGPR